MVQQYQVILMQGNASKTSETYGKAKAVEFDDTGKSLAMPVFERYPNVHEVKKIIAARMKIETPGPGRMNLPAMPPPGAATSREAFAKMMTLYAFELTAERYLNDEWVPIRLRNETWDGWIACEEIGRAHVGTPVTHAPIGSR